MLYVNQDDETLRAIRDELAPGRAKELPLDILFNIGNRITEHTTVYYNMLSDRGSELCDIYAETAYYRDMFMFDNLLDLSVFYIKPDTADSAYDCFRRLHYASNCLHGGESLFTFIDYDDSIMKYNTLFSIKEDVIKSSYTIVSLCDEFLLRYNSDGELETVYIFVNNVFVEVCFYDHGIIPFADKADKIDSEILTVLFNKEIVETASKVLTTVLETVEKLN